MKFWLKVLILVVVGFSTSVFTSWLIRPHIAKALVFPVALIAEANMMIITSLLIDRRYKKIKSKVSD